MDGHYPAIRLRRTRASAWSRAMVRETALTPADLIWPLFVTDGEGVEEPIGTLPGVSRWSVDNIVVRAREAIDLGIPCLALFPNTPGDMRDATGSHALDSDNLMCRAIAAIKQACGDEIGVLTDVARDGSEESAAGGVRLGGCDGRLHRGFQRGSHALRGGRLPRVDPLARGTHVGAQSQHRVEARSRPRVSVDDVRASQFGARAEESQSLAVRCAERRSPRGRDAFRRAHDRAVPRPALPRRRGVAARPRPAMPRDARVAQHHLAASRTRRRRPVRQARRATDAPKFLAHPHEQRVLGDDGLPSVDVAGGDEAHAPTGDLSVGDGGARHGDVSRASRSGGPPLLTRKIIPPKVPLKKSPSRP